MRQEMLLLLQRIFTGHSKAEIGRLSDIVSITCLYHLDDVLRHGIGCKMQGLWHRQIGLGGFAVLCVKIPLPTFGRIAVHEQAGLAAHIAIKILHAQLLAVLGPVFKFAMRAQKPVVGQDCHRNIKTVGPAIEHGLYAPFARLSHAQCRDFVPLNCARDFAGKATAVFGLGQFYVIDGPTCAAQIICMVAHGGQNIRHFGFMVRHIFGFFVHLRHQDDACFFVLPSQRRQAVA